MDGHSLLVLRDNLIDIFEECKLIPKNDMDRLKHFIQYAEWSSAAVLVKRYGINLVYKAAGTWAVFIPSGRHDRIIKLPTVDNKCNSIW